MDFTPSTTPKNSICNMQEYASLINGMAQNFDTDQGERFFANDSQQEGYAFAFGELTYRDPQIYEKKYRPTQYEQLISQNYANMPWATDYAYIVYDYSGRAEIQSGAEGPGQSIGVGYNTVQERIYLAKIEFEITQEELRQTSYIGRGTQNQRLDAAINAVDRCINVRSLFGDSRYGLTGLYNKPLVPTAPSLVSGGWLTSSVTADQICDDVLNGLHIFLQNTKNADWPTLVLLPWEYFNKIAEMPRFVTNAQQTVLEWLTTKQGITAYRGTQLRFDVGFGLEAAGVNGVPRMVIMNNDPRIIEQYQPMPLRFLAPQFVGTSIRNFGEFKFSPTIIRYPKSCLYVDFS